MAKKLPDEAYSRLLAMRTGLRRFERWSEQQAQAAGLTPAQHQLLLAIRGHGANPAPTVGEVADYLLLRHHSVVGLVDRAERAGLVSRGRDGDDHRVVRLYLTPRGAERLEALSALHLEELDRLALDVPAAWRGLTPQHRSHGFAGPEGSGSKPAVSAKAPDLKIARVYDVPKSAGHKALVDRLWPRGISKENAPFDEWCKDVAPSGPLRTWYGHVPDRFDEFARRYRKELKQSPAKEALEDLRTKAGSKGLVLVTATKDIQHSAAAVLQSVLAAR